MLQLVKLVHISFVLCIACQLLRPCFFSLVRSCVAGMLRYTRQVARVFTAHVANKKRGYHEDSHKNQHY